MGNPSFEDYSPGEVLEHLLCMETIDGKNYVIRDGTLIAEDTSNAGYLSRPQRKGSADPVVTGDPWVDAMERMVAQGVNPFDDDVKAVRGGE
jgi:hypothetical protein